MQTVSLGDIKAYTVAILEALANHLTIDPRPRQRPLASASRIAHRGKGRVAVKKRLAGGQTDPTPCAAW